MNQATPLPASAEGSARIAREQSMVEAVVRMLAARGVVEFRALPWTPMEAALVAARDVMVVDASAITSRMARLLYSLAALHAPARVLVVGSYQAAALAWLALGAPGARVLGVDVDAAANERARANCAALDLTNVTIVTLDGHDVSSANLGPIDLVLLDAEAVIDNRSSKRIYSSLLSSLRPHLAPGALVLAHDACWPTFSDDFAELNRVIAEDAGLTLPITIPIDRYGLLALRVRS